MDKQDMAMALLIISLSAIVGVLSFVVGGSTFGERCKKAGYSGAQFELCVKRAASGGPVYEENIEIWGK